MSRTDLTPRERELVSLLCEGLSNKAIQRRLGLSESTVKTHLCNVFVKLGATSRLEAAAIARRMGISA